MSRISLSDQLAATTAQSAELSLRVQSLLSDQRLIESQAERTSEAHSRQIAEIRADYEKKLKEKDTSYAYQSTILSQATNELEQAHAVLDGVEGSPDRSYERPDGYGRTSRNVVTRLAGAFLAIARNGGVK